MNEKISVIVPAYNIEVYIERTVESICQQTYHNLEIILVDDGSKDNTPNILDKLAKKDERIIVIHKENGGVTSARLTGIKIATGEWIGFVDGDDYIEPDMYNHLLENAHKYNAEISHCGYQMVFPSRVDYYYNTGLVKEQDNKVGVKDLIEGSFVEPGLCNKLFNRSLFDVLNLSEKMDLSIKNTEDLLMNYYLFTQAKKSVYEDFCPYHYLLRAGSAATSKLNEHKLLDPLKVYRIIEKDIYSDMRGLAKTKIILKLINLATISLYSQAELIRPIRAKARKDLREMLREIIFGNFSFKIKTMALWVSVWPSSYSIVHKLYSKISGIDKKYEVK